MFSPDDVRLRGWAARSSYLDERLASGVTPQATADPSAHAALADWRRIAAKGDEARFRAHRARFGLDEAELLARLGPVVWPDTRPLPDWAPRVSGLITLISTPPTAAASDRAPPFADLFLVLADTLAGRLMAGRDPAIWAPAARDHLAGDLVQRLSAVFTESLYGWFDAFRAVHQRVAGTLTAADEAASTELYRAFLAWLRDGHFVRLLDQLPVLARLLSLAVCHWEQHSGEFVRRFEADRRALTARLLAGRDPGPVTALALGVSDPHDHGRGVVLLTCAGGDRLVYKPRDLQIDLAWAEFLRRLAAAGCPTDLRTPAVLARPGYGWTSFIARAPCDRPEDVVAFFRRAGRLLALFQVLGASDFHQSNVIASGDQPVPVDLETLLRPGRPAPVLDHLHPATAAALRQLWDSVHESGYLPYWNRFRELKWVGGGLSWFVPQRFTVTGFQHINADGMRIGPVLAPADRLDHLPLCEGEIADPLAYAAEIEAGYAETCAAFLARRDAVHGALDAFRGTAIRPVLRDTQLYEFLNRRSLQPASLASGLAFSLEFEFLNRLHRSTPHAFAQVASERRALARLDIPLFRMGVEEAALAEAGGGAAVPAPPVSPLAHAHARLDRLDAAAVATQQRLVRLALSSTRPKPWGAAPWPAPPTSPWSAAEALRRATAIGERLRDRAIFAGDGAAWIGVPNGSLETEARLAVLDADLYDGAAGIAVFLAALGRVTGQGAFTELALQALEPLRRRLGRRRDRDADLRRLGIGGAAGAGGIVYAFTVTAGLTGCADLLDDAARLAEAISDRRIAADRKRDVVGGVAGAILGLLALNYASRPIGLTRAAACGDHLLRARPRTGRSLAGFSHGAAGFAYALQGLADATGEVRYAAAARDWLAYERTLFDPAAGNWRDIRFVTPERPEPDVAICRWCHGATGIGLARLGLGGAPGVAEDLEIALARTLTEPMSDLDSLCCGNFGRIELLLEAGMRLGRPELVATARARAAARLGRTTGGHVWMVGEDDDNLGLFQGLSGIGYELLRLAEPDALPCLLLWRATTGRDAP